MAPPSGHGPTRRRPAAFPGNDRIRGCNVQSPLIVLDQRTRLDLNCADNSQPLSYCLVSRGAKRVDRESCRHLKATGRPWARRIEQMNVSAIIGTGGASTSQRKQIDSNPARISYRSGSSMPG